MAQIRAFAKKTRVPVDHLDVDAHRVAVPAEGARTLHDGPKGFARDITRDSTAPREDVRALIRWVKRGCFIEQTLGRANVITHRLNTAGGWEEV